ncbi:MAG: orotidine-5'-phosphate decarboxylase [Oscillospiraceae bacterium]
MSFDSLIEKIKQMNNPTVAGLDPNLSYIPSYIKHNYFNNVKTNDDLFTAAANSILEFNKGLIDELYDIVPAVKPQCAYYEMYGWQGVKALKETISYAKSKGMYVIVDGKRNDIGTTMEAYSKAFIGKTIFENTEVPAFDGDALTVNGYLGTDGIKPLIDICKDDEKGIFVLCKTSNKSSGELQDQKIGIKTVYETMGEMCEGWGSGTIGKFGYSAVGAVVGATYPEQLKELREKMPHTFFLVPGYGAQGGGASGIKFAFDNNKIGAIINSSRAIMCAYQKANGDEKDFAKYAREEAIRMRDDIASAL